MVKKRIFLLISFFLIMAVIFGLAVFNKENLFFNKNEKGFLDTAKIQKNKQNKNFKNYQNVICEENWEKYTNDVLGIGFCYPKEWGKVYIDPVKDLTLLEGAIDEYSKDENNAYNNSLFIKFDNGKEGLNNKVELRIFNNNYRGEHYPNVFAYDKGYIDNIDKLKEDKNICVYRTNFTELWQEQGRMTESWSECESGMKNRIINHEQYFDKALYSYNLESLAYLNLQNNFFDNVLIKKTYLHISQIEKKINSFEEIFEAKKYPSNVDNSGIISQEEFDKQKEEFVRFVNSICSYIPITFKTEGFKEVEGEDSKITAIRKYYWLLEGQNLEEAYKMHNRINSSLDEFKSIYKKTRVAKARDFSKLNDNAFKFFVDYQDHNKPQTLYRITARVLNDEKIEIITIEEIVSDVAENGNNKAYFKKRDGKSFMILEKYGVEIVVDEGKADYDSNHSDTGEVKAFGDIKFSKSGKYLFYKMYGWEWLGAYIYDVEEVKEVFKSDSPHVFSFDKDEKNLFVCSNVGMSSSASGAIYSLPDFKKKFELFDQEKSDALEVACNYDEGKNELIFTYDKNCASSEEEKDDKCKKYEVVYSFDKNEMIGSKAIE